MRILEIWDSMEGKKSKSKIESRKQKRRIKPIRLKNLHLKSTKSKLLFNRQLKSA